MMRVFVLLVVIAMVSEAHESGFDMAQPVYTKDDLVVESGFGPDSLVGPPQDGKLTIEHWLNVRTLDRI